MVRSFFEILFISFYKLFRLDSRKSELMSAVLATFFVSILSFINFGTLTVLTSHFYNLPSLFEYLGYIMAIGGILSFLCITFIFVSGKKYLNYERREVKWEAIWTILVIIITFISFIYSTTLRV